MVRWITHPLLCVAAIGFALPCGHHTYGVSAAGAGFSAT